ncbi:MAG TPA: LamG-like jellyroll fold domain-containing protein [Verrucomicrobiae bacterium]|nr:LamG-like jellyroll fold domain-containing protein [Verrucomicrobiae bacterium]
MAQSSEMSIMMYRKTGRALVVCLLQVFMAGGFYFLHRAQAATEPPKLAITRVPDAVMLSWPDWATNWVLEESSHVQPPIPWRSVSSGNSSLRVNPAGVTNGFFRLRKLSQNVAGLSGHWQFDTGPASADDAPDGPMVAFTNASFGTGRVGSQSLHFNGAAAAGSGTKAWVSNSNYRALPGDGKPFSVSIWFSPDSVPIGTQGLIGNGPSGWNVVLQNASPGTNNIILSSSGVSVSARTLLVPGEWHELTITYDSTYAAIYLDGNLLARAAGAIITDQQPIYFGGGIGGRNSFLGRIDEVRTYTNALTAEQLALTGYWPLDETAGTALHDSSIYSHHGRVAGILSSTGKVANALQLTTNMINIPNDDFMVVPPSGNPFSVSFWIQPRSLPVGRIGLISSGTDTNSNWDLAIEVASNGETALALKSTRGNGTLNMRALCNLATSLWSKVDVTYNGAVATLYLNGRKLHHDSGLIQSARASIRVGYVPGAANFDGLIDELKIYRRERSESEIGPIGTIMWETVFRGSSTNFILQGAGPAGKALTYTILNTLTPTNGSLVHASGSPAITYQAGTRKGPDALMFTVSDGEFTSVPASLNLSVVEPHWLSPAGGSIQPLDGSAPDHAWPAPTAAALDAIWKTNSYYDCFYYAPGVYETSGARYGTRPTAFLGCKHIGSGSEGPQATALKLVGMWESWNEAVIFSGPYSGAFVDGFEVHNMLLDCNADNNPKYTQGEPVWIRLPLSQTSLVHSVTIRWNVQSVPGVGYPWQLGSAREFRTCTRTFGTNGYVTNCVTHFSTGLVDVVSVEAVTDEIVLQLDRRANGIEYYSISEVQVNGGQVRLPTATQLGGRESRLDTNNAAYSILRIVDQNWGTSWASGPETNVQITIPTDASIPIDSLTLVWSCYTLAGGLQLGPASDYRIRARRLDTGQYFDVSATRSLRNPDGVELNTFSAAIQTDQLLIELTAREADVEAYSLKDVSVARSGTPVALVVPAALNSLPFNGDNSVFQALDQAPETAWTCFSQGMIGALDLFGNNLKFTHLKVIGFGTKPGRECFAFYVLNPLADQVAGNVIIEDCLFTNPATNNPVAEGITCVSLFGVRGSLTNDVVRRCTVRGLWPAFPLSGHAFRANVVENCVAENCEQGVYFEPDFGVDYLGSVTLRSNRFLNVLNGVLLRFHPARQFGPITCVDNEIALLPGRGGGGFISGDVYSPGRSASVTNATLLRNVIRYPDWVARPGNTELGLYSSDIQNAVFVNNWITLGNNFSLRLRGCPIGSQLVPIIRQRCPPHPQVDPPPPEDAPPCLDILPSGYRRAWLNNRDLSGNAIAVRFQNNGVDTVAAQQQPPPEIP